MNFKKFMDVLLGNNEEDSDDNADYNANYIESIGPKDNQKKDLSEAQEIEEVQEIGEEQEEYIGDLPESTIRDIFIDLYSQLDIEPTKRIYRIFLDGWRDGLVNIESTTIKEEIIAPKGMDEFSALCMAFKGMLEEQLNEELDVNFVRGYCYCLCFFMPNK
ncbi:hypothetical protein NNC19_08315 [Clostridium sp. SHJSY1]|uniref:hypothetical protein n=1 Tax=Clostridium sp. SHJSY1 TaxID=2942483 RepID=UPI00287681E8|nr:hypothetical protein [Clostridium sp. SHJSY1]MDS0525679.1 hypothetical protein [Clostridium sp. SHJSY1]